MDQALRLLVIVVAAGGAATPTVQTMAAVAERSLSVAVQVQEESEEAAPTDEPGVVRVYMQWDSDGVTARLRLQGSDLTAERTVSFRPDDPEAERGRTLGYLVAAMLPESAAPGQAPEAPDRPVPEQEQTATLHRTGPLVRESRPPAEDGTDLVPPETHQVAPGTQTHPAAPPPTQAVPASEPVVALEAFAIFGPGLGDSGATRGFGGGVGFHWSFHRPLALHADFEGRTGDMDAARATTLWLAWDAGLSWTALRWGETRTVLALELGVVAGVARQGVTHYSPDDDAPDRQAVWTGTSGLRLEASWHFRPVFALVLRAAADVVFTGMDVRVGPLENIGLSRVREAFGLGIRADL